jgi:hypothetical protein
MASNDPFPFDRTTNDSFEGCEDDDSMASTKGKGQASSIRDSIHKIASRSSNILNVFKDGAGLQAETLCTACKKIPFAECLPGDAEGNDEGTDRISPAQDALIS